MSQITEAIRDAYVDAYPQLCVLLETMEALSKKKPDWPVNNFKLEHTNEILLRCNDVLGTRYCPFEEFRIFDLAGELPTASDVVMILRQYQSRMQRFRSDHTTAVYEEEYGMKKYKESKWNIGDKSE